MLKYLVKKLDIKKLIIEKILLLRLLFKAFHLFFYINLPKIFRLSNRVLKKQ
jgi:hypothetical protein